MGVAQSDDSSSASASANTIVLQLPGTARLSEVFAKMEARPEAAKIVHWSLRQPSLEEVFLKLSRLAEMQQHGLGLGAAATIGATVTTEEAARVARAPPKEVVDA